MGFGLEKKYARVNENIYHIFIAKFILYLINKICSCEMKFAIEYLTKKLAMESNKNVCSQSNQFDFKQSIFNKENVDGCTVKNIP